MRWPAGFGRDLAQPLQLSLQGRPRPGVGRNMKLLNLTAAHDNRRQGEPSARAVLSAAGPTGSAQLPGERRRRRARLVREVVLALPPTLTVHGWHSGSCTG